MPWALACLVSEIDLIAHSTDQTYRCGRVLLQLPNFLGVFLALLLALLLACELVCDRALILYMPGQCQRWRQAPDRGYRGEVDALTAACTQGGAWPIPWEHLFGVTWASLAAVESLRTGEACAL